MEETNNTEIDFFYRIAQGFKEYYKNQAEDKQTLEFFNSVYLILVSAMHHPVVTLNKGNKYWDATLSGLSKKLASHNHTASNSLVIFSQIYIIVAELLEVPLSEIDTKTASKNEKLTAAISPSELLNVLSQIKSLVFLSREKSFKNYEMEINKRIDAYHNKYAPALSEHRERENLKGEIYKTVKKDFLRYQDLERNLRNKLRDVDVDVKNAKEEISFIKEGASFLSAKHGLDQLAKQIGKSVRYVTFVRYFLMIALLGYLYSFLNSVGINIPKLELFFSGVEAEVSGVAFKGSLLSYAYFIEVARSALVNFVIISLLLYFYKVALSEERKMKDYIRELEFKATVTSFQEGNLTRVSELGGDLALSLERYERFLYSDIIGLKDSSVSDSVTKSPDGGSNEFVLDFLKNLREKNNT